MQITLPPELEQLVQRQLASGKYQSAIEVISGAVRPSANQLRTRMNSPLEVG